MALESDRQLDQPAPPIVAALSSASLSNDNQIGMTGSAGIAERLSLTTLWGVAHLPEGLYDAARYDLHHPDEILKTVGGSAALAVGLKVLLPEAGPVGKVAAGVMTAWFLADSAAAFGHAYKSGLDAKTWQQMSESGQQWGDAGGQVGLNAVLGFGGYKVGAGVSGRVLSGENFDSFADWKQSKWNSATDICKAIVGLDTSVPTASSVSLEPHYKMTAQRAQLIDSLAESRSGDTVIAPVAEDAPMNASVYLKSRATTLRMDRYIARMADGRAHSIVGEEFTQKFGARQESFTALSKFAAEHNLSVEEYDLASGRVFLTGKTADFKNAFGVELNNYATDVGTGSIGYEGAISMPKDLAPHIRAVLGMNQQQVARPSYVVQQAGESPALDDNFLKKGGYLATQIARAQNFPLSSGGEGQHGAFVSVSGGIDLPDYNQFFPDHGLEQPKPLGIIGVGGAKNAPNTGGADIENALDAVQMQSIAPRADIKMIIGNNNNQGLVDAFERAIFPKNGEAQNSVVSASWGLAENRQTTMLVNSLHLTFKQGVIRGVQIFSGSGDHGARALTNTYQPEYPASDPNVTGVGGLKMILDEAGNLLSAKAWDEGEQSSTGGGVSKIFKLPKFQFGKGVPNNIDTGKVGRGVPDISTNAASSTGFPVRVGGKDLVIGGTSAGAPLYAGLMLNVNAELAAVGIKPITPLNNWLYARSDDKRLFHDITDGGNYGYKTAPGWNAVTGLGWLDGGAMLQAMKESQTIRVPGTISYLPRAAADDKRQSAAQ